MARLRTSTRQLARQLRAAPTLAQAESVAASSINSFNVSQTPKLLALILRRLERIERELGIGAIRG